MTEIQYLLGMIASLTGQLAAISAERDTLKAAVIEMSKGKEDGAKAPVKPARK